MPFLPTIRPSFLLSCMTIISWLFCSIALAAPITLTDIPPKQPLGLHATYMQEPAGPLRIEQVVERRARGDFVQGNGDILSYGIGARPVWIHLSVINQSPEIIERLLLVENAWLDQLDVYFIEQNHSVETFEAGDALAFGDRSIRGRFFAFPHRFDSGMTDIYLRVETPDPMVVPVFLLGPEQVAERETAQGYSYGFLYGYLLALLAYNLFIYFGLSYRRHLLYAGFIASFVVLNIAYTGHGYAWLWPEYPALQNWIIPILMVVYGIAGLSFAKEFLETRNCFPRIHKNINRMMGAFAVLMLFSLYAESQLYAVLVAFTFVILFSSSMILLGASALRSGHRYARYFLFASIASMTGTAFTCLAVWGFIPFSDWSYRAVELGMMLDATLLSLALAHQFRSIQLEHRLAEQLAARDSLTGLHNRRAFLERAQPVWSMAQRTRRELSVILLDIDHFKAINDRFGHAAGDAALVAVSKVLSDSARDVDIVARWGGEEFLILLPETRLASALVMAERLRQAIAQVRVPCDGGAISLTASFGVTHKAQHQNIDELISEADHYLYLAKKSGRNRVCSEDA